MNFIRRHPRAVDVALALALCALVLLEVLGSDQDVPLNLAIPVALAMTLPFAWRRQYPVVVAMIVLVAFAAQGAAGDWDLEPQTELLAAALAFWVLGTSVSTPRSWYAGAAGFVLLVIHEPGDVIVMGPLMVGVFAAGRLMRSRSEIAKALERDRGEAERRAVLEERARISRELHDVVAHAISLMTVQAGAERLALGNERPQTSEALEQIEITGRQTLAEMRRLLGKLRDPEAAVDLAPQPGLSQLPTLAERVTRAGLPVALDVEGTPGPMWPGVDISAYRIVQEGLTNALKHAKAQRATVRVRFVDDRVELEIADDGRGSSAQSNGSGHGLSGMRERVALYGGTLDAGPQPQGGWAVQASLPQEPTS